MKPVVSSIVALALALTPAYAMAAEKHGKPVAAKVAKHKKTAQKIEKGDKPDVVKVHQTKKDKAEIHRASHVEAPHKGEPKVEHGAMIQASLTTKPKPAERKPADIPKLPAPNAKSGKNGSEKGVHKAAPKKASESAQDGQPGRDEELADLVARIRGQEPLKGDVSDDVSPAVHRGDELRPRGAKAKQVENAKCWKDPVEFVRGAEIEKLTLMKCDGTLAPLAVEHLSLIVRPGGAARPTAPVEELAKKKGPEIAKGIRRVDARLVERLQAIVDHFGKSGTPTKLDVVSGYRPTSTGSMHASGRAIDFRIEGVDNDKVVAFCKTLDDTGCGFYPNSSFVHVDVRDAGAGHVSWIDASSAGESPRYVASWPPPEPPARPQDESPRPTADKGESKGVENTSARRHETLDRESAPETSDDHPAE